MQALTEWDYNKSVSEVKEIFSTLKGVIIKKETLTDKLAKKLYEAREQLSNQGQRTDLVANATKLNWQTYLKDCGLERTKVFRWLEHYEPEKERLLSDEEYDKKKEIKKRERLKINDANRERVIQAISTGEKPTDWNNDCELMYRAKIQENRERNERIKRLNEKMEKDKQNRENNNSRAEIDDLLKAHEENEQKKREFRNTIRLTGNNASHDFNDILLNYIVTLNTDTEKMEACHNIIKICKGIVSKLQKDSVRNING